MIRRLALLACLPLALLTASPVNAACLNPAGTEGENIYNADYHTMQFCNGTNWVSMAASGMGTEVDPHVGTLTNGKWCSTDGVIINCNNDAPGAASQWTTTGSDIYFNGGNVGIGTTNPAQKLTVAGTIESITGGIKFPDGTTQTTAFTGGAATQWFNGASSAIYYNTGNVAIGTTNAIRPLTVAGGEISIIRNASSAAYLNVSDGTGSNSGALYIRGLASNGSAGANLSLFQVDATNASFNGNVGIGTASPNAKLQIANNVATGFLDTYGEYQILLYDSGAASSSYGLGIKGSTLVFNSGGGAFSFDRAGGASALVIDTAGNVGIGTPSPSQKLTVVGTVESTTGGFKFPDGTTQATAASSSVAVGNITGLGTGVATWLATPSTANLAAVVTGETGSGALVFGTSPTVASPSFTGIVTLPTGAGTNAIGTGTGDGASYSTYNFFLKGWWGMALKDNSDTVHGVYDFRTGNITTDGVISLAGTGNNAFAGKVGIGSDSPTQKLDVAGNITASLYYDRDNTGYYVDPNSTSNIYTLQAQNNVYVGAIGDWISNRLGQDVRAGAQPNFWNIYVGYLGWLSNFINQDVRNGASPSFGNVNASGWVSAGGYNHSSCYYTGWVCSWNFCSNGYFMAGIHVGTPGTNGCGGEPPVEVYCCH